MLRRVCILTSYNLYESKRYFSEKLAEALQRQGIEVKVIDTLGRTKVSQEFFESIRSFAPNFTCSFNSSVPFFGRFFWEPMQIPHLSFLVDPFLYSTIL